MVEFKSKLTAEQLTEAWDEFTSPSRFAGSDDTLDLIFISKRNKEKVRLVHRARNGVQPFNCIFRGRIVECEGGSAVKGTFTKSIFDYGFVAAVIALLFYIRYLVIERGDSLHTINVILACSIIGSLLLLINTRATKRKYADFITRITREKNVHFLKKNEMDA